MAVKVIVFIGEGNSEISFFQEFIQKHYLVSGEDIKSQILYSVGDCFIIFAHPVIGKEDHRGGDKTFLSAKTYVLANGRINQCSYAFSKLGTCEFTYLFLTDKDKPNSDQKLDGVEILINKYCPNYKGNVCGIFAIKEIETWFLAGLGDEFLENYPETNLKALQEFLSNTDIENINDTKELLKDVILSNTSIARGQEFIGREFGKYMDTKNAKERSPSFKEFLEKIDSLFK